MEPQRAFQAALLGHRCAAVTVNVTAKGSSAPNLATFGKQWLSSPVPGAINTLTGHVRMMNYAASPDLHASTHALSMRARTGQARDVRPVARADRPVRQHLEQRQLLQELLDDLAALLERRPLAQPLRTWISSTNAPGSSGSLQPTRCTSNASARLHTGSAALLHARMTWL